jgi:hypothetical protein
LQHEVFVNAETGEDDMIDYEWLKEDDEEECKADYKDVRSKLYSIFMERSSILFAQDPITIWLKETAGFLIDRLDDESLDRLEFIGKIASVIENPFKLSRYMELKNADFTDDVTTIDPNELLGAGGPPAQNQAPGDDEDFGWGNVAGARQ